METRAREQASNQRQGTADAAAHQPAHDTAAVHEGGSQQPGTDDPPTHLLSLPHHVISSLILPRVSSAKDCRAFLSTCKAARSMSSTQLQADWLQRNRPATALYLAAESESRSEALVLDLLGRPGVLSASAAKNEYGDTLLVSASVLGYCQAVRVLLQRGVDPNTADKYGRTSLMAAASFGHASVVETLLQDGINQVKVDQVDDFGFTALHYAAVFEHAYVVRLLLQARTNVNARSHDGDTPLHMACLNKHPAVVTELLQCVDFNTELRNQNGDRAIDVARKAGCDEIVCFLEQHASHS